MLKRDFYARDAETVARDLLGCQLLVRTKNTLERTRIVETEAYVGEHDLACHAAKGRTKRTETMFGPAGHAYVYLIYGIYDLLNVVTGPTGEAQAVLIRAVEPVSDPLNEWAGELAGRTDGPGRLTKTLGITRALNGTALFGPNVWLERGPAPQTITVTPRIGVDYAGAWKDAPLRFFDAASPHVSRRKPG
ncbi:DNA-3-methyladenine glycosylase [soil metagenome]